MKGYDRLLQYAADNPDIHFIAIWKWEMEATRMEGASNFVQIPQVQINELLNAADFFYFNELFKFILYGRMGSYGIRYPICASW